MEETFGSWSAGRAGRAREEGERAAGGGEHPAGAGHRRPGVAQERRPAGNEAAQGGPLDGADRPPKGGRHTARHLQEDVRSLAARGVRPAGRVVRDRRGARMEGNGALDQIRGGRGGRGGQMGQAPRSLVELPLVAEFTPMPGDRRSSARP